MSKQKVLVVRFSSMGDVILTSPVVRILNTQTEYDVHFITKRQFAHLLEGNPYIDKLYLIDKDIREVIEQLKAESYEYIIDLHKSLRSYELSFLLRKGASRVNKLNFRKWIFTNFQKNFLPDIHIVDRYLDTLKNLDVRNDGKGLDYIIHTKELTSDVEKFLDSDKPILAMVIGAAHFTKIMPLEIQYRICQMWEGKIILIGGPAEQELGESLEQMSNNPVMNLAGILSIDESVYALDRSDVVIAGDTGMMHLSAAIQKPLVLVWGSTHEAFGMTPYYGSDSKIQYEESFVPDLSCRPCTKMGLAKCPQSHFQCMKNQKPEEIVKKAVFLYEKYASGK